MLIAKETTGKWSASCGKIKKNDKNAKDEIQFNTDANSQLSTQRKKIGWAKRLEEWWCGADAVVAILLPLHCPSTWM